MTKEKGIKKYYNVMRWLYLKRVPLLPKIIKVFVRICFGCVIPYKCHIGKNTIFPHGALGVVLHEECRIGDNCKILQNVTIGGKSGKEGVPIIGDNVLIGAGAAIIGKITIGNHSAIGANSVVTKDVPENSVVIGIPGKILRYLKEDESVF